MNSEPYFSEPRLVQAADLYERTEYHSTVMLWEHEGAFYHYRHRDGMLVGSDPEAERALFKKAVLVPREYYLAKAPPPESCALRAPSTALSDPNVYIKRTKPFRYDPVEPDLFSPADFQANEMRVCEMLRERPPHPNICRYLGYMPTPDGEYVAGLCFERLHMNLVRARDEGFPFDARGVVDAANLALFHLHCVAHCHNYLRPHNVVFDKDGVPFLTDFETCYKIGDSLEGTRAQDHWTSDGGNDYRDLRKLQKWLADNDSSTTEEEEDEEEEEESGSQPPEVPTSVTGEFRSIREV